jgi:hypothetical protein
VPLQKIQFKPGVNRENTRYTTEGGFYESEKIRFRQGTPEVIGGWQPASTSTYLGVCRSLWNWVTLSGYNLMGVGTNLKFYIENGGAYFDNTPLRTTTTLNGPFTTDGTTTMTVTDAAGGFQVGDFVTFSNATAVGGVGVNNEYEITSVPTATTYTVTLASAATAVVGGGGTSVHAAYQVNVGNAIAVPSIGWGAGGWGLGTWGTGAPTNEAIRLWSQNNFGQDLIYGPRGGNIYYWSLAIGFEPAALTSITYASPAVVTSSVSLTDGTAIQLQTTGDLPGGLTVGTVYYVVNSTGTTFNLAATYGGTAINTSSAGSGSHSITSRGIPLSSLGGASDAPTIQNSILVSDTSRFVMCFGVNALGETELDPMLIRWSDQENAANWTPSATNQAGDVRLSHGSRIVTIQQTRQEILVWTDSSLYSLQYLGPPVVWGSQLLADNISIAGPNAVAVAGGVSYWMGVDKFYKYDGRTQTLRCDLRRYIFNDLNVAQADQIFASTNEGFNEVWFFYCSANSTTIDKYVVYNYVEDAWYYGTMSRTAWIDSGLRQYPVAAYYNESASAGNLLNHESGLNDNTWGTSSPIEAYILSSEFDIGDGHNFGFVWRMIPDLTFNGSTASTPAVTMYLYGLTNSGSGYNSPASEGGQNYASVARTAIVPIEQFTGQIYTRVRGRQMAFKIYSNQLDTTWQLGAPRIDIRPDGRR